MCRSASTSRGWIVLSSLSAAWALALGMALEPCVAQPPEPIFYLSFDGTTRAAPAGGQALPRPVGAEDTILTLLSLEISAFRPGKVGQGYRIVDTPLVYECEGNFRADEGTCAFWLSPEFRGDDEAIYCTFFGAERWGMAYKYLSQQAITFGTAKPDKDIYYDCSSRPISAWRPGQWHHLAFTWSRAGNTREIYVDGKLEGSAPLPYHRPVLRGPLFVGGGCELYPQHAAHGILDEFALWDRHLGAEVIAAVYEAGMTGESIWPADAAETVQGPPAGTLGMVQPKAPTAPEPFADDVSARGRRRVLSLDGWWQFLPAASVLETLPAEGWGLARVPGYWTEPGSAIDPEGKPVARQWAGRAISELPVAYLQHNFTVAPEHRNAAAFLQLDGVDGLARVFVNGKLMGRLPGWEHEAYDVTPVLHWDRPNTVILEVRTRGTSPNVGIYGSVSLRLVPPTVVNDVVVRPRFEKRRLELSCDIWHSGDAREATLEFEISPAEQPGVVVQRFTRQVGLQPTDRQDPRLSTQVRRVECAFDWDDAHPWNIDDPFLYQVTARISAGGAVLDETGPHRFGFREFALQGSDFVLNGKPVHLRGHQIDLGWGSQFEKVKDLKLAGMNCFELSGPVRADWYGGATYKAELFKQILNYADEHGLLAMPALPDAKVLRQRLFEPQVARLYRQRLDKHTRRYGNHPSVVMWHMHFNLAGYRWYIAPDKIDGSYKPEDEPFAQKERYCLEAQRILRSVDPRPVYHHACGNLGDIFTLNCYIGPTSPLQERSEWPSAWAAKRPFPLMACEHGLILAPYWFRPRQFPLSVVYGDEPLFDEIAAQYLGPEAYGLVTPELFDLYDVGRRPRASRLHALVRSHSGYHRVKSLYARESLRAWRTWGISGIVFNAISWDFRDTERQPLPVLEALGRYFGDTDLYIAGPGDDWPSKDHSYWTGERVRKQVVLLNDLARDIPCTVRWQVRSATGDALASGQIAAVAQAGVPSLYPIEFEAPDVDDRGDFALTVQAEGEARDHFRPETFTFEVFGRERPRPAHGTVLLYDTAGRTTETLQKAGAAYTPLNADSDLTRADALVVGAGALDEQFIALAERVGLDDAIRSGLGLLVMEQTRGSPMGLRLTERSARRTFIVQPGHPVLAGLSAEDFINLRGQSDLIEAYPESPPETMRTWPKRFFKWGNRGTVATFVYTKPHYAPYQPVLECGFDLVESPLLDARFGRGRVVLCQVDVSSRYGADPVSTRLLDNLLAYVGGPAERATQAYAVAGTSAGASLAPFGCAVTGADDPDARLTVVSGDDLSPGMAEALRGHASRGATVLVLPGRETASAFGLEVAACDLYKGELSADPLLAGLSAGDVFLKKQVTLEVGVDGDGWRSIVAPGLVLVKKMGKGRIVACGLDPAGLGQGRARVKALRLWNMLLCNLGIERRGYGTILAPKGPVYEDNQWEQMPGYINW